MGMLAKLHLQPLMMRGHHWTKSFFLLQSCDRAVSL
jgi:hypothetical protein